jgi:hypothetical protein
VLFGAFPVANLAASVRFNHDRLHRLFRVAAGIFRVCRTAGFEFVYNVCHRIPASNRTNTCLQILGAEYVARLSVRADYPQVYPFSL